ncbi:hypothetical protein [Micromonospora sp. LOL_027]|uniref:hypothetical protein n=1 Tax=Micromonospora sp. LOL_027 TaxID=3345419 RepID=UPI003A849868
MRADALRPHSGGCGGEDFQDLLVGGAGDRRVVGGELGGGERAQGGAGGGQGGQFAVDAAEFGGECGDLVALVDISVLGGAAGVRESPIT